MGGAGIGSVGPPLLEVDVVDREEHARMKKNPRRILAVLRVNRLTSAVRALSRARSLATRLDAEVDVLLVRSADPSGTERLFSFLDGLRSRVGAFVGAEVLLRTGSETEMVWGSIRRRRPAVIVVSETLGAGGRWARVASRAGVPVFVARRSRRGQVVVAATDASDPRYPTMEQAVAIAVRDMEVDLVHNIARSTFARFADRSNARAEILYREVLQRARSFHVVVTTNSEPTTAVVEHAGRRDADVVVIGAHRNARPGCRTKRTAARLIEQLDRSVLVVPLAAEGAAR